MGCVVRVGPARTGPSLFNGEAPRLQPREERAVSPGTVVRRARGGRNFPEDDDSSRGRDGGTAAAGWERRRTVSRAQRVYGPPRPAGRPASRVPAGVVLSLW